MGCQADPAVRPQLGIRYLRLLQEEALCKGDFKSNVNEQPGSASVVQSISSTLNAIGYSGIGYKTSSVRAVPLSKGGEAFEASEENALAGKFPLARFFYVYVNKAPNKPLSPIDAEFLAGAFKQGRKWWSRTATSRCRRRWSTRPCRSWVCKTRVTAGAHCAGLAQMPATLNALAGIVASPAVTFLSHGFIRLGAPKGRSAQEPGMNDMDNMTANSDVQRLDFNTPALQRKRRIRALKDHGALVRVHRRPGRAGRYHPDLLLSGAGRAADVPGRRAGGPQGSAAGLAGRCRQAAAAGHRRAEPVALRLGEDGRARFFSLRDGALLTSKPCRCRKAAASYRWARTPRHPPTGARSGQWPCPGAGAQLQGHLPEQPEDHHPELAYPFGEAPLELDPEGRPIERAAISLNGKTLLVAGATGSALHAQRIASSENLLTGEVTLEQERLNLPQLAEPIRQLLIDPRHMWFYAISGKASADVFDLRRKQLNGRYKLVGDGGEITSVSPLLGGISLMVGDSRGSIGQWFMVRAADGRAELKNVRNFKLGSSPVRQILPEERRKGFLALDDSGSVGIFHSTAHRTLLKEPVADGAALAAMSPRATRLLLESAQGLQRFVIDNPHPEISWSALWGKVWYESYPEPITSGSPPLPTVISNPS